MSHSRESRTEDAALREAQKAFSHKKRPFSTGKKMSDVTMRCLGALLATSGGLLCWQFLIARPHSVHLRNPSSARTFFVLPLWTLYGAFLLSFGRRGVDRIQEKKLYGWLLLSVLLAGSTVFGYWYCARFLAD